MPVTEIEYGYGSISAEQLSGQLEAFIEEYRQGGPAFDEARAAGIGDDEIDQLRHGITFREPQAGLDAETVKLIVEFAPLIVHIGITFWDEVLLKRLKERYGDDVLGPEKGRK